MSLGKINLITPPDKLFNDNISYLLVKPSTKTKIQFQSLIAEIDDELNVFIFDEKDNDIDWLLSIANIVDNIIVDIDNCDSITKQFVVLLMSLSCTHYITNDEVTPYKLINRNRIYDLDALKKHSDEEDDQDQEEENE